MTFLRPVSSRLAAALRGAFWGALVLAVTMALLPHPPALPVDAFGDKFEHVLAFSIMALLAAFAYPLMPLARIGERLSFLGALIEVFQSIPALHRDCDIRDWIADSIAIHRVARCLALVGSEIAPEQWFRRTSPRRRLWLKTYAVTPRSGADRGTVSPHCDGARHRSGIAGGRAVPCATD